MPRSYVLTLIGPDSPGLVERLAEAVADAVPGDPVVHVTVDEGMQLSELRDQDTHSYEIATVRLGARDQAQERRDKRCQE